MDFSQIEMIYRAEGNANLVIYLPQYQKVLRLPKLNKGSIETATAVHIEDHVAYINLMENLLGTEYIIKPEILHITAIERDKLNQFCAPFRPAERLDKEFCGQFGLLFPDATDLLQFIPPIPSTTANIQMKNFIAREGETDKFAIEIKPKQGWMLQDLPASFCGDLFDLKGSTRCRYCSMQFSKLKSKKISTLSGYCPMDLFSGNRQRMAKALENLFENPQNNLRIFRNSRLFYDDSHQQFHQIKDSILNDFELLKSLIIECLLRNYTEFEDAANAEQSHLPFGSVLHKILTCQLLVKKNLQNLIANQQNLIETKTYQYLKTLIRKIPIQDIQNDLTSLEQYLLGATILDCSIIINFQELQQIQASHCGDFMKDNDNINRHKNYVQIDNRIFVTKITILDLDPKAENHFSKFITKTNQAYFDIY